MSIDIIQTFDEYAVKALEDITERLRNPSGLPDLISAILSIAGFGHANVAPTKEQITRLFITTATKIGSKVDSLIGASLDLEQKLFVIQEKLDLINGLVIDEIGDLPRMNTLGALWSRLAHPGDYEGLKSHSSLLMNITRLYTNSSSLLKATTAALNCVEAELKESREDLTAPGWSLLDQPLEVIITLLRKSGQRLEAGKRKLLHTEDEEGPQRNDQRNESRKTITRTTITSIRT